jgi:hypothetical protein
MERSNNMKSVIERISIQGPIYTQAEKDWAIIAGKDMPPKKPVRYFKHKKTGHEYLYILGAFALPGLNLRGYAIVIGLDRHEHPKYGMRIIRAIEEVEDKTTQGLMKKCIDLQKKYSAYPVMNRLWYADLDEVGFDMALAGIKKSGKELYDICPASGPYAEKVHPWKGYLLFLSQVVKFLDRRDCPKLRSYMAQGPKNLREVMTFKPEHNPAIAAIAVGISALLITKPWFWEAEGSAFNLEDW